ncbi:response regulator transcription factor [Nevskia ramosa]|uniref:response regulator transcription factor n=1 Tax=Nevskia ramosa TaxID=64002 RepID=UPI002354024E|nr:response regulator [Nevskia ramosa]
MDKSQEKSGNAAVRVYLVDDQPNVTKGLSWLLESAGIASETHHRATDFLAAVPDYDGAACVVLDLRMPEIGGLEAAERLAAIRPDVPIIFLTAHGDVPTAVHAMKLGATDFLQKPFDPQVFLDCVSRVSLQARQNYQTRRAQLNRSEWLARLSVREHDVLERILAGASSKQIARDLEISPRTIDVHRANILAKLGIATVRELLQRFGTTTVKT